jgi:CMP-N-acetylneuraminic acid synthetase
MVNQLMKKYLCVIPARMGSQRVRHKNLLEIEEGVTLVQQALDCCLGHDVVISTDQPDLFPQKYQDFIIERPKEISEACSDISDAVKHALSIEELKRNYSKYDYVVTLQPAVVARSAAILQDMISKFEHSKALGAVTAVKTHPWIWEVFKDGHRAKNSWSPGPYPRSQDSNDFYVEINSIQITTVEDVRNGKRWNLPLMLYHLPEWASVFDIDTPEDMQESIELYGWAKSRLNDWRGSISLVDKINT